MIEMEWKSGFAEVPLGLTPAVAEKSEID